VGSEILKPKGKSMFAHFRPTKYQRKANRPKSPVFPLHLELLEDRTLPSSYSVTELPSLVAGTPHAAADPMYTVLDLGTLGGPIAFGVSSAGRVVGGTDITTHPSAPAVRTAPTAAIKPLTVDLGTLGGIGSIAFGINDAGQMVGQSETTSGNSHAFRTAPN